MQQRTVTGRLEVLEVPRAAATVSFADDVRSGLSKRVKALPSKYLYDDIGSALFEAITLLPEYYLTRAESEILREWGWEIVRILGSRIELLELGSGSASKTRLLIAEALRAQPRLRYSPVDISPDALYTSSRALVEGFAGLNVRAFCGDYFGVLASGQLRFEDRVLSMFLGSNIGNYAPEEAIRLVKLIGAALRPGDGLLIGTDRKKDRETLERAYDDAAGVTAAFDRNLLARINRELGGDFDPRAFQHVVHYDERRGCIDSFLESSREQRVRIDTLELDVPFASGERIHVESSYKFDEEDLRKLADATGFFVAKTWTDRANRFDVHMLVRA
jgi:L-histidine Nalpha-methyltransferase